jgi:serine/threonine protein kinase
MRERYQFIKRIGRGGFGKITLFYDHELRRKVVQKSLINPTHENCQRLIREGEMYMQLQNEPHVIDQLDYRFDYPNPYLIIPYYEEGTLERHVGNRNWYDSALYIQHGAIGLRAVHRIGGIHRDAKPSNLFLDRNADGKYFARLGDFGLGRVPQPFTSGTMTQHACGTPDYMAPELYVRNAKFTQACDIYSLGITGIELITGSRKRESIKTIWINNDVSQLLWEMTSWTPSQRPSADQVVSRISALIANYNATFNSVVATAGIGIVGFLIYKVLSK